MQIMNETENIMHKINYHVERTNLYESIADNLEEMIVNDASQIGQKLPSEQTMAVNFGVSRNVIRESLKILKERHLISLRTGEGAYIEKPDNKSVTQMLNRIILMDNIDHNNIFEVRKILESNACRMAAERNSPEDFEILKEINDQMEIYKDDVEKRIEYDIRFHIMIATLSHNPLLELFIQSMTSLLFPILRTALIPEGGNEGGIEFHRDIIRILCSGDGKRAEKAMQEHLRESAENYLHGGTRD